MGAAVAKQPTAVSAFIATVVDAWVIICAWVCWKVRRAVKDATRAERRVKVAIIGDGKFVSIVWVRESRP